MKIDLGYIRQLLAVFLNSETAHIDYYSFPKGGVEYVNPETKNLDEKFLFHFQLLAENNLISNRNMDSYDLKSLGLYFGHGGDCTLSTVPLRLTQAGHDFALSLNEPDVFETLKENFSNKPLETIYATGQELLKHYAKKKLDALLSE
ncbi:DUF2513 domain-containing protein [Vibrio crassostreae]|uniref:DUF2513 domain-containing protein n=1 Tax=Vibrio crassostreae TaxID=246167 RepID=UPI001043EFE9|nr:DUF2513 domain-containing protein [Vibrio crassostreae]TCV07224.1 uncharacterized protein DUF2513 [Vibrio crassostreae]TWD59031.1 uncharacterized protein DUF2513 [Vibrio crassostreae]